MRIIKFFLFGAITLFLALTALSLLFPSNLRISRVTNVPASKARTLEVIADLRSWGQWNRFVRNSQLTNGKYSSPSSGAGARFSSDQLRVSETGIDSNGIALQWDLTGGKTYRGGDRSPFGKPGQPHRAMVVRPPFSLVSLGKAGGIRLRPQTGPGHGRIFGQPAAVFGKIPLTLVSII